MRTNRNAEMVRRLHLLTAQMWADGVIPACPTLRIAIPGYLQPRLSRYCSSRGLSLSGVMEEVLCRYLRSEGLDVPEIRSRQGINGGASACLARLLRGGVDTKVKVEPSRSFRVHLSHLGRMAVERGVSVSSVGSEAMIAFAQSLGELGQGPEQGPEQGLLIACGREAVPCGCEALLGEILERLKRLEGLEVLCG